MLIEEHLNTFLSFAHDFIQSVVQKILFFFFYNGIQVNIKRKQKSNFKKSGKNGTDNMKSLKDPKGHMTPNQTRQMADVILVPLHTSATNQK